MPSAATDFWSHEGYNLRQLVRTIVSSRTYQLTRAPAASIGSMTVFTACFVKERYPPRFLRTPLAQDRRGGSVRLAIPRALTPCSLIGSPRHPTRWMWGRCPRERPCDAPWSNRRRTAQALQPINGQTINDKLRGDIEQLLVRGLANREIIEESYVRALTDFLNLESWAEWEPLLDRATAWKKPCAICSGHA
jgi:hypothetical protein